MPALTGQGMPVVQQVLSNYGALICGASSIKVYKLLEAVFSSTKTNQADTAVFTRPPRGSLKSPIPVYDIIVFFSPELLPGVMSFMAYDHTLMGELWVAEDKNHGVRTHGTMRFRIICFNEKNNR
ncbi:DNA-binding protein Fis [Trichinella pseudospiralis]